MAEPLAHLYDLALRALGEQQRRADALRGRIGPVLAAAALGASLLTGPLLGGDAATGGAGALAIAVTLGGLAATLGMTRSLLTARNQMLFDLEVHDLIASLEASGALRDPEAFYVTMLTLLGRCQEANVTALDRLNARFTSLMSGILVMLCGLAGAALVA